MYLIMVKPPALQMLISGVTSFTYWLRIGKVSLISNYCKMKKIPITMMLIWEWDLDVWVQFSKLKVFSSHQFFAKSSSLRNRINLKVSINENVSIDTDRHACSRNGKSMDWKQGAESRNFTYQRWGHAIHLPVVVNFFCKWPVQP